MKISELKKWFIGALNRAPMLIIFLGMMAGIIINESWRPDVRLPIAGFFFVFMMLLFIRRKGFRCQLAVLVLFLFIGMIHCRAMSVLPSQHLVYVLKRIDQSRVTLRGRVVSDVPVGSGTLPRMFDFDVDEIVDEDKRSYLTTGRIRVKIFKPVIIAPGDRMLLSGKVHRPYDFDKKTAFSYKKYLYRRGIYYLLTIGKQGQAEVDHSKRCKKGLGLRVRENLKKRINKHLPTVEAGILRALLLGDRTGIPKDVQGLFTRTGTAHVLAISGLHIGIITFFFLMLLSFLPVSLKAKYAITAVLILAYIPIAGARTPVTRSSIMAAIFLLSFLIERRAWSYNMLGLAGFIILCFKPLDLYSIGFQLSFSAVASLITFMMLLPKERLISRFRVIIEAGMVSFVAWLGALGWILYYFGMFTPVGLLANIGAVFLVAVVIMLGFVLLLFDLLGWSVFAGLMGLDITFILSWLVRMMVGIDRIPGGHFSGLSISSTACAAYYAILIIAGMVMSLLNARKPSLRRGLS